VPGKPSSWLSTEAYIFSTTSLAVVEEKLGQTAVELWIVSGALLKYPDSKIEAYNILMYQSLDQSLAQYIIQVVHSHTHKII
jgi:hypothetical protein